MHDQFGNSSISLRFLPDNRILAISDADSDLLCLWQWRTEPVPRIVQHDVSEGSPLITANINNRLTSSPDGQLVAAMLRNPTVIVADCTGNLLHTIRTSNGCIAISPNKEYLATFDDDGVHLFDLKTGKLRWSLEKYEESYNIQIAFSPDGRLLAFTNHQGITLWDLHARRRPQVLRTGETSELVFSADGSRLRTNWGMWPLPSTSNSLSQPLSTIPADLAAIGKWVTWKLARVLWIPHHLVLNTFVAGNVVAFVSQSGLPIWIVFDLSKWPTDEALINPFTWEEATDYKFEEVS